MEEIDVQTAEQAKPLDRFHEIEIEQLFQAIVQTQGLRVQAGIFFSTVYLGALGIAFTTQNAGLVMLASGLLWGLIIVDMRGRRILHSFFIRALELQEAYAPHEGNTYLMLFFTHNQAEFKKVQSISNREVQQSELGKLLVRSPSRTGFWLPLFASIVGIGLGLLLWLSVGWSLF